MALRLQVDSAMTSVCLVSLLSSLNRSILWPQMLLAQKSKVVHKNAVEAKEWIEDCLLFNKAFCLLAIEEAFQLAETIEKAKISHIYPGHHDFPSRFLQMSTPPLCLFVKGRLPGSESHCLSIVGGRAMRDEVREWLNIHLSEFLQKRPVPVISGGARGVDQAAHGVALRNSCPTVVLLPSGLQNFYPAELKQWEARILDGGGAIASEFHPSLAMRKYHFARRNRLIAAMGDFVLIAQAARSSGTLVTALHALNIGKTLGVIPHFPGSGDVMGSLDLLRDGALPLRDADDLVVAFESLGPVLEKAPGRR